MRSHQHQHPKLKTQPRPLFSCSFFRHCTQSVLSPTNPTSPSLPDLSPSPPPPPPPQPPLQPPAPPPPPPPQQQQQQPQQPSTSSSSSSSSTSQSFTQWRFPLPTSPIHPHPQPESTPPPPPISSTTLQELFHVAELQLSTGSDSEQLLALQLLERSLVPNPPPSDPTCPPELMRGLVANLKNKVGAKPATKVLLALCLAEGNRHVAVESGAVGAVVEVALEMEAAAAERALAALELMCTVAEGAAEIRAHALAVPVMVTMMGNMAGRGREYAISVLAVIYGGGCGCGGGGGGGEGGCEEEVMHAPPEEVARAVVLALQADCTTRGKRKGAQLLKILQEYGRLDLTQYGS